MILSFAQETTELVRRVLGFQDATIRQVAQMPDADQKCVWELVYLGGEWCSVPTWIFDSLINEQYPLLGVNAHGEVVVFLPPVWRKKYDI